MKPQYTIRSLNWVLKLDTPLTKKWEAQLPRGYLHLIEGTSGRDKKVVTLFLYAGSKNKLHEKPCKTIEDAKYQANVIYVSQLSPYLDLVLESLKPEQPCSECRVKQATNGSLCEGCFQESRGHT